MTPQAAGKAGDPAWDACDGVEDVLGCDGHTGVVPGRPYRYTVARAVSL
jgi:hypothetical protein